MEQDFNDLLNQLLDDYESNNNVDSFIDTKMKEYRLSPENERLLKETNSLIEEFDKNENELRIAKESGKSRKNWFRAKLDTILEGRTEKEQIEVANTILSANDNLLNQLITEE